MPELPEVETVCRGISSFLVNQSIVNVVVRQRQLRWPINNKLSQLLKQKTIVNVWRRAKYIIIDLNDAHLLIHLGMSGRLLIVDSKIALKKHDHVDIVLSGGHILRYHDPRRFGAILWSQLPHIDLHPRLVHLGVEPLSRLFNGSYLKKQCLKRKRSIKSTIMDQTYVVGVGNIYANEALFLAGIHPSCSSSFLSLAQCQLLSRSIKIVLRQAIKQGGTTLKDFSHSDGSMGYFQQSLNVYGRDGWPCVRCASSIDKITLSGRATYYCPSCQRI